MKQLRALSILLILPLFTSAQIEGYDFGSCFNKTNRKSIDDKMEKFLTGISKETNCHKDKLTYTVDEFFTTFYTKECRHLPKKITVDICGEKRTYIHDGLSGNITYWLLGSWSLTTDKKN